MEVRTQVDHNNSAGAGKERSEGVDAEGCSIQEIDRGSHAVVVVVGRPARTWE